MQLISPIILWPGASLVRSETTPVIAPSDVYLLSCPSSVARAPSPRRVPLTYLSNRTQHLLPDNPVSSARSEPSSFPLLGGFVSSLFASTMTLLPSFFASRTQSNPRCSTCGSSTTGTARHLPTASVNACLTSPFPSVAKFSCSRPQTKFTVLRDSYSLSGIHHYPRGQYSFDIWRLR